MTQAPSFVAVAVSLLLQVAAAATGDVCQGFPGLPGRDGRDGRDGTPSDVMLMKLWIAYVCVYVCVCCVMRGTRWTC